MPPRTSSGMPFFWRLASPNSSRCSVSAAKPTQNGVHQQHARRQEQQGHRQRQRRQRCPTQTHAPTRPASLTTSLNPSRNQPADWHAQEQAGAATKQPWLNGSCVRKETCHQAHLVYSGGSPTLQLQLRTQPHRHPVRKRCQHSPMLNSWIVKQLPQCPQRQQKPETKKQPKPPSPPGDPLGSSQAGTVTRKIHRIAKPMDPIAWAITS